ncbi:helix-turn-helix domain-containing protein [Streptomyces sp. LP05-1]|uniref:Helix-turn-helix domain-containing protein n=1 Tax=Streptomyces pyxinae TaxID=2970734 RepID=A0ABT2CIL9_9ACTN|nr:helix-turn-helix domain-containing protein [Streptomyces sp. LP05-1]MCS0636947.1 helix-turn-helix domain-containing protein [Streptomyces sp. LP05-1]
MSDREGPTRTEAGNGSGGTGSGPDAGAGRVRGTAPGPDDGLAERVRRLRRAGGLTQRQVAEPDYTAAYISTLEAGRVRPSEAALRHIAARLGVTYDELATGRSARLVAEVRLRVTDARRVLATEDAREAAPLFAGVRSEAARLELPEEEAAALLGLGECALETGELQQAVEHFRAAEELLADAPLPRRVPALRGRATAHLLAGDLRYACYLLETAIDRLNASGLPDPEALLLLYSAVIAPYMDMGAHTRAAQAAELALALAPRVADPALLARMHRGVARTLIAGGRPEEADAHLLRAQEMYRRLQIRTELAHCHWMRGYVHAQSGQLESAEAELREARTLLAEKRAGLFAAQVGVELGDVLRRRDRPAEAAALLDGVLAELGPEHGAVHAGAAHRLLGLMAEQRDDTVRAEREFRSALDLLRPAGAAGDVADLCRLLGDLLHRTGRLAEAVEIYRSGLVRYASRGSTTLGPAPAQPPL